MRTERARALASLAVICGLTTLASNAPADEAPSASGASSKSPDPSPNVAAALPNYLVMDSPPALRIRIAQLRDYLRVVAKGSDSHFALKSERAFCGGFSFFDAASLPRPLWLDLDRIPRDRMVETLADLSLRCGSSPNGASRAAWALDFLYFNRLADTTGHEVADVLGFRDALVELYIATILEDALSQSIQVKEGAPHPHSPDFLDAKPMSSIDIFRRIARGVSALSPEEQPVIDEFIQLADFREGYLAPFGRETLAIMKNPRDLAALGEFFRYETYLRAHPALLKERHGGWHRLMAIVNDDAARGVRILGLLASVHLIVFRDLVPALAKRGELTPEITRAFYEGALSYFLVNELDERAAITTGDHALTYHFFFPDEYQTKNWKWYHWYNNAFTACELKKSRRFPNVFSNAAIVGALGTVAFLYEGTELNMAIPWRQAMELDPRVNPIVEGFSDIRINEEGATYGAENCH